MDVDYIVEEVAEYVVSTMMTVSLDKKVKRVKRGPIGRTMERGGTQEVVEATRVELSSGTTGKTQMTTLRWSLTSITMATVDQEADTMMRMETL